MSSYESAESAARGSAERTAADESDSLAVFSLSGSRAESQLGRPYVTPTELRELHLLCLLKNLRETFKLCGNINMANDRLHHISIDQGLCCCSINSWILVIEG